jgi:Flp pilus assembly pilin Flp
MIYILDIPPLVQSKLSTVAFAAEVSLDFGTPQRLANLGSSFFRRLHMHHLYKLWHDDEGQDIAEYAVMLAVILVIVVGTIRLIGSNANNVFSNVASSIQ